MEFLASRDHRIGLEVIDSVGGEHLLVNVEVAAIAPVAGIASENQRGRVCNYRRRAAMFWTDTWNHLERGGLDHCSRPKRIDSDAIMSELRGVSQHAHRHAILGHCVSRVLRKPVRLHV